MAFILKCRLYVLLWILWVFLISLKSLDVKGWNPLNTRSQCYQIYIHYLWTTRCNLALLCHVELYSSVNYVEISIRKFDNIGHRFQFELTRRTSVWKSNETNNETFSSHFIIEGFENPYSDHLQWFSCWMFSYRP